MLFTDLQTALLFFCSEFENVQNSRKNNMKSVNEQYTLSKLSVTNHIPVITNFFFLFCFFFIFAFVIDFKVVFIPVYILKFEV